jgi:hypothetical protein
MYLTCIGFMWIRAYMDLDTARGEVIEISSSSCDL